MDYTDEIDDGSPYEDDPSESDAAAKESRQARRQKQFRDKQRQDVEDGGQPMSEKRQRQAELKEQQDNRSGKKKGKRVVITKATYLEFLFVAVMADLLSFLINFFFPGVGGIIEDLTLTPITGAILWYMYRRIGIDVKSKKVAIRFFIPMVVKFIPILNALPEFTFGVVIVLGMVKSEEWSGRSFDDEAKQFSAK